MDNLVLLVELQELLAKIDTLVVCTSKFHSSVTARRAKHPYEEGEQALGDIRVTEANVAR